MPNKEWEELPPVIERLIKAPILPKGFDMKRCAMTTALDWYRRQSSVWRNHESRSARRVDDPLREEWCELLEQGLGHIAANPSVPANVRHLKQAYVFPAERDQFAWQQYFLTPCDVINSSEEDAEEFLQRLIVAARGSRERYVSRFQGVGGRDYPTEDIGQSRRTKWILVGDRGIGKTIFLNYLLGTKTDVLHDHRVIWYRVDYTKHVRSNITLEDWLHYQLLHVLFRYYDRAKMESEDGPTQLEMRKHWKEKAQKNLVFDFSADNAALFNHARRVLPTITHDEFRRTLEMEKPRIARAVSPVKIDAWLHQAVVDHLAVDCEIGFVAVVDGLDKLGLSRTQDQVFHEKIQDVKATVATEAADLSAYLITMRIESYRHHFVAEAFQRGFERAVLQAVPALPIWRRKCAYLENGIHRSAEAWPKLGIISEGAYREMIVPLLQAYGTFISYSASYTANNRTRATSDIDKGFDILERLFGADRRQLFEALATVARFFVHQLPASFELLLDAIIAAQESTGLATAEQNLPRDVYAGIVRWRYLLVEALMLQRPGAPFYLNRYRYEVRESDGAQYYDRVEIGPEKYILNLFAPPFSRAYSTRLDLLLPSRVIQYVLLNGGVRTRPEIQDFLETYFDYPRPLVDAVIDELLDAGLLRVHADGPMQDPSELESTDRAAFLIRRLVTTLEYISIALHTAVLPSSLVDTGLFQIRPYASPEFIIDNKIVSSINFARLVSDLERREESHFNERARGKGFSFATYRTEGFGLRSRINDSVSRAISAAIRRAYNDPAERNVKVEQIRDRLIDRRRAYFGVDF